MTKDTKNEESMELFKEIILTLTHENIDLFLEGLTKRQMIILVIYILKPRPGNNEENMILGLKELTKKKVRQFMKATINSLTKNVESVGHLRHDQGPWAEIDHLYQAERVGEQVWDQVPVNKEIQKKVQYAPPLIVVLSVILGLVLIPAAVNILCN